VHGGAPLTAARDGVMVSRACNDCGRRSRGTVASCPPLQGARLHCACPDRRPVSA